MIRGIGIDVVEIGRVRAALGRHGERARRRLFTARELAECAERPDPEECLAARFAAKEASLKALGTGKSPGFTWRDVEVTRPDGRSPVLELSGAARRRAEALGVGRSWVSLTHEAGHACAVVVLEGEGSA